MRETTTLAKQDHAKQDHLRPANFAPNTFEQALKFSEMIARSSFAPIQYKNKPEDIFLAIQMGAEIGLAPMQSLQNIAVINGKPSVYGDAALALVQRHPAYEWHKEFFEGDTAVFQIKRKGSEVHECRFSTEDAKSAGLTGKPGPWTHYERRMKQMRARGFGLRDKFADALKGLITAEEAMDYPEETRQPETITDGETILALPTPEEPIHREGNEHQAKDCKECLREGVPKDCTSILRNGHFFIRRGEKSPQHDLAHKSHVYCPACKADKKSQVSPDSLATGGEVMDDGGMPVLTSSSQPIPSKNPNESLMPSPHNKGEDDDFAEPARLFKSGNPEIIKKIEAVHDRKEKLISKKDKDSLIHRAVELGWNDAGFNRILEKFHYKNPSEITTDMLNEIYNLIEAGPGVL